MLVRPRSSSRPALRLQRGHRQGLGRFALPVGRRRSAAGSALVLAVTVWASGTWAPAASAFTPPPIYWANTGSNTIGVPRLDATSIDQSFVTSVNGAIGVAVDGQYMYWTNSNDGTTERANLDGTGRGLRSRSDGSVAGIRAAGDRLPARVDRDQG